MCEPWRSHLSVVNLHNNFALIAAYFPKRKFKEKGFVVFFCITFLFFNTPVLRLSGKRHKVESRVDKQMWENSSLLGYTMLNFKRSRMLCKSSAMFAIFDCAVHNFRQSNKWLCLCFRHTELAQTQPTLLPDTKGKSLLNSIVMKAVRASVDVVRI